MPGMDPASIATALDLGNGAYTALATGTSSIKAGIRRLRLSGYIDIEWLNLDEGVHGLTATDAIDVAAFLKSTRVRPLLSLAALTVVGGAGAPAQATEQIKQNFIAEAHRWCIEHGTGWKLSSEAIWRQIEGIYRGVLPSAAPSDELTSEVQSFTSFLAEPISHGLQANGEPLDDDYAPRLVDLASNIDRIIATEAHRNDLIRQIRSASQSQPIFSHSQSEHFSDFAKLYVSRTFIDIDSSAIYPSEFFLKSGSPFRAVLLGTPGAGKTTFVRHLVDASARHDHRDPPAACLVIRCRDYVRLGWNQSVVEFLTGSVDADLHLKLTRASLEDLLLLGQVTVIFDGLDEVTNQSQRSELARRIQAFAARYPALSILISSREVGYDRAPLAASIFKHIRLNEFTEDQIYDYADRWFNLTGRPDLRDSFLDDSSTIPDIRTNPLLLSLLCVLYREHGAIPLNRRDIYAQCARELFHRWDAHRQIRVTETMPRYGDRLMQEIARWFYTTPSTNGGLDEQVLSKVISNFMRDALGFDQSEAEPSARDFLEFCAGRAWLLGRVGATQGGVRVFNFTHRTFYEYFAAEAVARSTTSSREVANTILAALASDATSVLPELLIQAYDAYHERGAAEVYDRLCQVRAPSELLLRLMEGSILPRYARAAAFDLVLLRYRQEGATRETCRSLFTLTSSARRHYIEDYVKPENKGSAARDLLLHAWAGLQLSGLHSGRVSTEWESVVDHVMKSFTSWVRALDKPAVINWLVAKGDVVPTAQPRSHYEYLVCDSPYGWVPGALWWALNAALARDIDLPTHNAIHPVANQIYRRLANGRDGFPATVLDRLSDALDPFNLDDDSWNLATESGPDGSPLRDLMVVLLLAFAEQKLVAPSTLDAMSTGLRGSLMTLVRARISIANGNGHAMNEELRDLLRELPPICERWTRNEVSLVR